ncbi:hypothetical protein D3C86_1334220 [compost metagenome]
MTTAGEPESGPMAPRAAYSPTSLRKACTFAASFWMPRSLIRSATSLLTAGVVSEPVAGLVSALGSVPVAGLVSALGSGLGAAAALAGICSF